LCVMLNRTSGKQVKNIIYKFFTKWPNPQKASQAPVNDIAEVIQPLGLFRKRADYIQKLSNQFLTDQWTFLSDFKGVGKYGNDSYRIFCCGEWQDVQPTDHKLNSYHNWISSQYKLENHTSKAFNRVRIEHEEAWCVFDDSTMEKGERKWWRSLSKKRERFAKRFNLLRIIQEEKKLENVKESEKSKFCFVSPHFQSKTEHAKKKSQTLFQK